MYQIRYPAKIFNRLKDPANEEDTPIRIVTRSSLRSWTKETLTPEEIRIIDEVNLYTCRGYGGYLDDKWVIVVIDDDIDTR